MNQLVTKILEALYLKLIEVGWDIEISWKSPFEES
jgi:hypothetical protein